MKVKTIPSSWITREGRRLDCGPYMSGALETRVRLEKLAIKKDPLRSLTKGYNGGIYNGPKFSRTWVGLPEYGVPFVGSSDMLMADLSGLPLLRKKDALSNKLSYLRLAPGMTLISCSGTIGRMVYTRPDMDGLWSSQHIMKVVPDPDKIPSGYLYAYLSSKFGVPQVVSGTYGSIIQSIEPHHIADLPVPRLGDAVEQRVHALVEEAAHGRSCSANLRRVAVQNLCNHFHLADIERSPTSINFATFSVRSSNARRFDAAHHSPACVRAANELATACEKSEQLGDVTRVFTPGIFKRIHVNDPNYGYAYFSGSELFQYAPDPRGYLSRKAPDIEDYIVHNNWLLVQDAGQLGGLIGRLVRVGVDVDSSVVSNHLIRIVPQSQIDAAYLFALLISPHGYRAMTRHAFGTSIPQLDPKHIATIRIPWPEERIREQLAKPIMDSWGLEDRAITAEREAIRLVEQAIEEAT